MLCAFAQISPNPPLLGFPTGALVSSSSASVTIGSCTRAGSIPSHTACFQWLPAAASLSCKERAGRVPALRHRAGSRSGLVFGGLDQTEFRAVVHGN